MHFETLLDADALVFRADVRAFLARELDPELVAADDDQRTFVADHERGNLWLERLRPRRWHVANWPVEFGGAGLPPLHYYLLQYEQGLAAAPAPPPMGLFYVGPVVMKFGTAGQQARYLPPLVEGRDHWCQGFSEPGAGSDLARVQCYAERIGDRYRINGSKIWTTDAQHANKIFCLVRTRRDDSRQAMSFLLVDMATPGITVRPIRMLTGDHEFNQVFFDDVEVDADCLLGAEGEGWTVARYLLEIERGSFVFGGRLRRRLHRLEQRARARGALDACMQDALARLHLDVLAYEVTELRCGAAGCVHHAVTANMIKIEWTEIMQRMDALALRLAVPDDLVAPADAVLRDGEIGMPGWFASYFNNRATTIYGGSNEIQRNLVFRGLRQALGG